jgi:hypothetical protein
LVSDTEGKTWAEDVGNRVLGKKFGPKKDEVAREWRRLLNLWSVLLTKYDSGDRSKKNVMGWACSMYGERRGEDKFLVGEPEGRRSVGRTRRRLEDNIKMDFQDLELGGVDCIDVDQDMGSWRALVNAVMNLGVL